MSKLESRSRATPARRRRFPPRTVRFRAAAPGARRSRPMAAADDRAADHVGGVVHAHVGPAQGHDGGQAVPERDEAGLALAEQRRRRRTRRWRGRWGSWWCVGVRRPASPSCRAKPRGRAVPLEQPLDALVDEDRLDAEGGRQAERRRAGDGRRATASSAPSRCQTGSSRRGPTPSGRRDRRPGCPGCGRGPGRQQRRRRRPRGRRTGARRRSWALAVARSLAQAGMGSASWAG